MTEIEGGSGVYRTAKCECPHCGTALEAATPLIRGGQEPLPGDITVCLSCSSPLQFDEDMRVRPTTVAAVAGIDQDAAAQLIVAIALVRASPGFQHFIRQRAVNAPGGKA